MKTLIEEFPFLRIPDNTQITWLDCLEPGWKKAFGLNFCEDLKEALIKDNMLDSFMFTDIKEKYAGLRLYTMGYGEHTKNILAKYEELSKFYCGHCGKPARYISEGWYYTFCEECIKEINGGYIPIEDYYGFPDYDKVQLEIKNIIEDFQYDRYWKSF